jgi:hypothetical protein
MVIPSVQVHLRGPVGRDLAIGAGPHRAHPGGNATEVGRREEIGRIVLLIEAALCGLVNAAQECYGLFPLAS